MIYGSRIEKWECACAIDRNHKSCLPTLLPTYDTLSSQDNRNVVPASPSILSITTTPPPYPQRAVNPPPLYHPPTAHPIPYIPNPHHVLPNPPHTPQKRVSLPSRICRGTSTLLSSAHVPTAACVYNCTIHVHRQARHLRKPRKPPCWGNAGHPGVGVGEVCWEWCFRV